MSWISSKYICTTQREFRQDVEGEKKILSYGVPYRYGDALKVTLKKRLAGCLRGRGEGLGLRVRGLTLLRSGFVSRGCLLTVGNDSLHLGGF